MSKSKDIKHVQTNPYWPGCHIVEGRNYNKRTLKVKSSDQNMFYSPMSIQHLDDAFDDDSGEETADKQIPHYQKYDNFPDISTDNNTLSVLNRSGDVICVTLSLVGSKYPIYYHQRCLTNELRAYP